jgi:hypothetical protein
LALDALNNAGQFSSNSNLVVLRGVLFAKLGRTEEGRALPECARSRPALLSMKTWLRNSGIDRIGQLLDRRQTGSYPRNPGFDDVSRIGIDKSASRQLSE